MGGRENAHSACLPNFYAPAPSSSIGNQIQVCLVKDQMYSADKLFYSRRKAKLVVSFYFAYIILKLKKKNQNKLSV